MSNDFTPEEVQEAGRFLEQLVKAQPGDVLHATFRGQTIAGRVAWRKRTLTAEEAQAEYDNDPEMQQLLRDAAESPTVERSRQRREGQP